MKPTAGRRTLSVVMPNYNHARFLPESLEAIGRQSRPPDEFIIVDDASTDGSVPIIEAFVSRHPFASLLRQERREGPLAAARRAFERCTGDYVLFSAADDKVMPGLFEKSLGLLERHPDAGLCSSLARMLGPGGEDQGPCRTTVISRRPVFLSASEFVATYLRRGPWFVTYSTIYRRDAVADSGAFELPPELGSTVDGYMLLAVGARHGACYIPEELVWWRRAESGYAFWAIQQGLTAVLAQIEGFDRCLRSARCAGLFPEDFLRAWKRRALATTVYEHSRRAPDRLAELLAVEPFLPGLTWLDRGYFALLRRGWAGLSLTKLYLTLQQPWQEQARIIGRRLAGRG